MPAVSMSQMRAMRSAAAGHSDLGIPAKVGAEFVAATPSTKGLPNLISALRRHKGNPPPDSPKAPEAPESPAEEKMEMGMSEAEKYARHRKMSTEAGSPAARAMHKKLMTHHKMKMDSEQMAAKASGGMAM